MKRIKFTLALTAFFAFLAIPAFSQKVKETEKDKSREKEQIVITRKGDDKEKVVIEINGDKVTINGKAIDDLKDGDITVHRNKIRSGDGLYYYGTPGYNAFDFNWNDSNGSRLFRNMNQNMAMLGVTTEKSEEGVKVKEVSDESAAEKAGLKKDDIITKVDDKKISDPDELSEVIRDHKPGDKVTVTILRDKKEQKVIAELGKLNVNYNFNFSPKMPDMKILEETLPRIQGIPRTGPYQQYWNFLGDAPRLGLSIQDTEDGKGVKVIEVDEDSNGAKAGIKEEDVITHFNDKEVNTVDEVSKLVKENKGKVSVMLKIKRDGKSQNIEVKMPRRLKTTDL